MKEDHKKFSKISKEDIKRLMSLPKKEGEELMKRVNYKLYLEKPKILKQAFEKDLLTKKEYEEKYKDMFYDDYGADSFMQYLNAVMNSDAEYFITINERLLKRKEELKKRFGIKIASPKEIVEKN